MITPGDQIKVFQTKYVKVAVAICYDIYFPEWFTVLAKERPDIIFFPSLQRSEHELTNEAIVKVRAIDTRAYPGFPK